jgi:hypothetical protein
MRILEGEFQAGDTITVDALGDALTFRKTVEAAPA